MRYRTARHARSVSTILAAAVFLTNGCGSDDEGGASTPDAPDTSTFEVTWSPETAVIDESHVGLVRQIDHEGRTYTLDATGIAGL